eukprot:m.238863 g.238863  ORF g.238863 m.238863 type:complete len:506 (-) comp22089_c0_seq1:203-1720(-)
MPASQRSGGSERKGAGNNMDLDESPRVKLTARSWQELSGTDKPNVVLLIILYCLQGIPLGLVSGSLPFLLKERLSYSELAVFSLASYPYSLKLIWSPIVDAIFSQSFGRRKSWIVPTQIGLALLFWFSSFVVDEILVKGLHSVGEFSALMFVVIFLAATQDIAVDGWALTLLSKENLSWASSCQTIGLQIGFFASYTVFLALNSKEFCNEYFFSVPQETGLVSAGVFMRLAAIVYTLVTAWLVFFKKEDRFVDCTGEGNLRIAYRRMLDIFALPAVRGLALVLLVHKLGFVAGEVLAPLKLIEKGFRKDRLALTAVIDFPIQVYLGLMAARWCSGHSPMRAFLFALAARHLMPVIGMALVAGYPGPENDGLYFLVVLAASVATSFCSTVMFVCVGAFFARISDPLIGGTYLTLLNTLTNFGGTWPRSLVLEATAWLTVKTCTNGQACERAADCGEGAECITQQDGFYIVSGCSVVLGTLLLRYYVWPTISRLQNLPETSWRVEIR